MVTSFAPRNLAEAIAARAGRIPLAGGTDLLVKYRAWSGLTPRLNGPALFLNGIPELRLLRTEGETLYIGACVTLSDLLRGSLVPGALRAAAVLMGSPAIRNRATIGGNVCNASPAGDTLPPLYVLDAEVILAGANGERKLSIAEFVLGPGKTALRADELLKEIAVKNPPGSRFAYRKIGTRRANALSKLSVAALSRDGELRVAFGAVAPTVVRLPQVERLFEGCEARAALPPEVLAAYARAIRPINDQRSSAFYRKEISLRILESILRGEESWHEN